MSGKFIVLKPFVNETDTNRYYDILRSVIFAKKIAKKKNLTAQARSNLLRYARTDRKSIYSLRKKYPVISSESVANIAREQNVHFKFWTRQNTRSKPKFVTQIGSKGILINLKLSCFETFHEISFSNLTMLLETDQAQFHKNLSKKIAKFTSIAHAISHFTGKPLSEEEFFEIWGDHELRFREEERFIAEFGIGFSFWSDDIECKRLRGSWDDNHIPILLSTEKYRRLKFSIFDEITAVIDKSYLKDFRCEFCFTSFKEKRKLQKHEKSCQKDTEYHYSEKQYGGDQKSIFELLVEDNIIPENDECYKHFCSFDIECVNVPEGFLSYIWLKIFEVSLTLPFKIRLLNLKDSKSQ